MNVIYTDRSTNGRWGVDIVSSTYCRGKHPNIGVECILDPDGKPVDFPLRGVVTDLGEVDGIRVIRIEYDPEAQTWLAFGELINGGTQVLEMSLQSHRFLSLNVIGPVAVLRTYGYRRRSSTTFLVKNGQPVELSPSQLLALGLIQADRAPESSGPIAAAPVETEMMRKLKSAGLL